MNIPQDISSLRSGLFFFFVFLFVGQLLQNACPVSAFQVKYQLRKRKLKIEKFRDVCMTGGIMHTPSHTNVCKFFNFQLTFSQVIFHLKC